MRYLALDWERAFGQLEVLGKASLGARQRITRAELKAVFEAQSFGEDRRALLAVGVLAGTLESNHVRVAESFHDAHKLLRALARVPLANEPDEEMLARYVAEHFDEDERYSLGRAEHGYGGGMRGIVGRLTSAAHTRRLLEAAEPAAWEAELLERTVVLGRGQAPKARLSAQAAADLALLLQHLIGGPGRVRARELPRLFPELTRARLALAVELGLRYCVLFCALDPNSEVLLFQWPGVHARLRLGKPARPTRATVSESFTLAFALEDLQHLLVHTGDGLRMKSGGEELFAAAERELASGFLTLPEWLTNPDRGPAYTLESRVRAALEVARAAGFLQPRTEGRSTLLAVAEAGWSWLERAPRARLEVLLSALREAIARSDGGFTSVAPFKVTFGGTLYARHEDPGVIPRALAACFRSLEAGHAVEVGAFARYHAHASNPLRRLASRRSHVFGMPEEEELEEIFQGDLLEVLFRRLTPWGGTRTGVTAAGALAFEMTSIGRYLLGLAATFELERELPETRTPVRVQPDFEVLFVAPSAMLEARIGRFAERHGRGVGLLFRITRDSIFGAARAGLDADEVLATLSEASATPLPANVVHEIKAWFARCRHFELESVQLLRCPDAETAERVLALGAKYLERLSDTLLALHDPARKAELLRACAKQGLFLGRGRVRDEERAE